MTQTLSQEKSPAQQATLPGSLETGGLGVRHLKRLWARAMAQRAGSEGGTPAREFALDKIVLYGLGLPLEETLRHIYSAAPSFAELEAWIAAECGGAVDAVAVARINAAIAGEPYDEYWRARLAALDAEPPALSADDLAFFDAQGYVILRNAVPREAARAAENVIWRRLGMRPDAPEGWYHNKLGAGIMVQLHHEPELRATRASPRIRKAYAQLLGTSDIWLTIDRAGFNPPERDKWRFPGPRLHWDADLTPPLRFSLQGVLYLTDTEAEQGAFTCVPGFQRRIDAWLASLPPGADPQAQDLEALGPVGIAAGAGDLIIWDDRLPHGSRPNRGHYPRIVQYIAAFPSDYALDAR